MLVADSGSVLFALLVVGFVYFLPSIVGRSRGVTNLGSVFVLNLFLGWTLIGWVVALAMAARTVQPKPPVLPTPSLPAKADTSSRERRHVGLGRMRYPPGTRP